MYSQAATPNKTAEDTVLSAFHILNQFDILIGSVINAAVGDPTPEITEWTSVTDLKNLSWYFRTFQDQSIRMVDLKEAIAAAKGEIGVIEMEQTEQPIANVSANVTQRPGCDLQAESRPQAPGSSHVGRKSLTWASGGNSRGP